MQKIAIYDLDRTILKTPTFTAFLIFAAREKRRSLLWRAPIWIGALLGYKAGLYGRKRLKQFGIRLFIGGEMPVSEITNLSQKFANSVVPYDVQPGAAAAIEKDRVAGCQLIIATAAPEFYVAEIAKILAFDDYLATRHLATQDGAISNQIIGENCYGEEKLERVKSWFAEQKLDRDDCHIIFYSDHESDGPLLDWADEGIFVTTDKNKMQMAIRHGWQPANFNVAALQVASG